MLPALPLRDVLDDEEVLARPDVPERPGFAHDYGKRPCAAQPVLQRGLLLLQLPHRRDPDGALRSGLEVVVQRPVVEQRDERQGRHREPTAGGRTSNTPTALLRSHSAEVLRLKPRSFG